MYNRLSFNLPKEFVNSHKNISSKRIDNALGVTVMSRTYMRSKYDDQDNFIGTETFIDVCERVVNGVFSIVKDHNGALSPELEKKAEKFFDLIYNFRITPPGRGFWAMGTRLIHEMRASLALVNCTFISTNNIDKTGQETFAYIMDALMLGVGVGFDDEGAGLINITQPGWSNYRTHSIRPDLISDLEKMAAESGRRDHLGNKYMDAEVAYYKKIEDIDHERVEVHVVLDSRDGWVNAVRHLIGSYMDSYYITLFDYSQVRQKGIPLKTFGGTSSGPGPLAEGIAIMRQLLEASIGKPLSSLLICDLANVIATIVIAGNVRRSSQIFISKNPEMIKYKDYNDPEMAYRMGWSWSSNNSLKVDPYYSLDALMEGITLNGEPGIFNIELCRHYGRIIDGPGDHDLGIEGTNPCGEISLQGSHPIGSRKKFSAGGETCNLCETFPGNYEGTLEEVVEEYGSDLWFAVFYCKIVTMVPPHWKSSEEIQNKNRRIGVSQTGIMSFIAKHNLTLEKFAEIESYWYGKVKEYDAEISEFLNIPQSIKLTTVKPSGTVTLCAGLYAAGMHAVPADYFIRNMRISVEKKDMLKVLQDAGYPVEPDVMQPESTMVVSFPCRNEYGSITKRNLTVEYQYQLLAILQTYWSDNQVSCTISFTDEEAHKLPRLQQKYKDSIKSVSFLKINTNSYVQAPEIEISEEEYLRMIKDIKPITYEDFVTYGEVVEEELDNYCSGDKCVRQ